MSYPRVNLLRKNEQRYQGAVSRRFILVSAVVTPVLLIAVLSGIKLIQYNGVQADLKANREIWKTLEPKISLFNEERRGLETNQRILSLFDGWRDSQLPLVDVMTDIQIAVPPSIQFTRLSMRGEITPMAYESAEQMKLDFKLQIEGNSQGDRAEDEVWRLHKELLGNKNIAGAFGSIDLADMRKKQSANEQMVREFKIMGNSEGGAR